MDGNLSIELISWAMNRAMASHNISRINVANANVEGYSPISISFKDKLEEIERSIKSEDLNALQSELKSNIDELVKNSTHRIDGETVQVDLEVANMVKASGYYQALAEMMSRKMGMMKLAIGNRG